jgi:hypothetical protein
MSKYDRLKREQNLWVATTRPDGRPHLVPIWFVWVDGKAYIFTGARTVKARNLFANPRACIALESGSSPVIAECTARLVEPPFSGALIKAFREKYDWNIEVKDEHDAMFELTPQKWVTW